MNFSPPSWRRAAPALCSALLLHGVAALAQQQPSQTQAPPVERKQVTAVRIEGRSPSVDGRLDEEHWQSAPAVTDFVQKEPAEGQPSTERTEVRFAYDGSALYVGARMYSADPARIQAPMSRRDAGAQSEQILVILDTYLDRRTAYTFGVTASGVRLDWYHPVDREGVYDPSFNPVWVAKTQRDSLGWTAEMRIPYSQLRFNLQDENTWGLNIRRFIPNKNEEDYWVMIPPRQPGWASRFGDLGGLKGIRPTRRIELMPYVASGADFTAEPGQGNPFDDGSEYTTRVGGDVKMGLGPNMTLEATVNPDFGQVDADPAEVNLSAFETFFAERRPFFTEAGQLLAGNGPMYFYSRRIGASPMPTLVDGVFRANGPAPGLPMGGYTYWDVPNTSTILGAAKLAGRMASGMSIGALAAVTDREYARTFSVDSLGVESFDRVQVGSRAGYAVLRGQQEFGPSGSTVGLSFTGVRRDLSEGSPIGGYLPRTSLAGGVDWNLLLDRGNYEVNGYVGYSFVEGDSAVIGQLQRAPARYFQRPDADHVEFEPGSTSLSGYTVGLSAAKVGGKHWLWSNSLEIRSPGFEINDVGRNRTADDIWNFLSLTYRETRPGKLVRNYRVSVTREDGWNFGGVRTWGSTRLDGGITWKNFWQTVFSSWIDGRANSEDLTRGGPLAGLPRYPYFQIRMANSSAATTRVRASTSYGKSELGHQTYSFGAGITHRPHPAWQFSLDPYYERTVDPQQYIGRIGGRSGPTATYGDRYIFSTVERSTVSAQLRLDYTIAPDLSLGLYAEPFAASGRFYDHGELPEPRSRDLSIYGTSGTTVTRPQGEKGPYRVIYGPDPLRDYFQIRYRDFNVRSFRSNAVLRWEWRPGSTLFLVWQQDRYDELDQGRLVDPRSLWDTFSAAGDNILALKATYWIPLK
ncbi:MAG TPA: DUF5916 domain-containing protein [Longimicrobiaceae bacterium]|nr:DUF5916 domain-containing protein [Longimicrobiaceae bacterium]